MDPFSIAVIGVIAGGLGLKGAENLLRGQKLDVLIANKIRVSVKGKKVDPHVIRRMEIENGMEPSETCYDPFCRECFTGIRIDIDVKPRERIVDGYLVPVPRIVPDEAYAYAEVDPITQNIKIYWKWSNFAGTEKTLRTMTPKIEVKEID